MISSVVVVSPPAANCAQLIGEGWDRLPDTDLTTDFKCTEWIRAFDMAIMMALGVSKRNLTTQFDKLSAMKVMPFNLNNALYTSMWKVASCIQRNTKDF